MLPPTPLLYKIMDPHLFEKEVLFFSGEEQCQKKPSFLGMHTLNK